MFKLESLKSLRISVTYACDCNRLNTVMCVTAVTTQTELSACFWVNLQHRSRSEVNTNSPPLSSTSIWTLSTFSEIFVTKPILVSSEFLLVPPPSYVYVLRSHPVTCSLPCKCWWVRSRLHCSGLSLNFCGCSMVVMSPLLAALGRERK